MNNLIYNINNDNYPTVLDDINTVGFSLNNKINYMYALSIAQQMIDEACWYGATSHDIHNISVTIEKWIRQSGLNYTELINEIYFNLSTPGNNPKWELYKDSLAKLNMNNQWKNDNPIVVVNPCATPPTGWQPCV